MAGTASTRNVDRDRSRTRPNSVARLASSGAPVLLRLPIIEKVFSAELVEQADDGSAALVGMPAVAKASAPEAPVEAVAEPAIVAPPPMPVAVAAGNPSTEPKRSWWEHWSSGIVLILLIIALVVASILALNDSPRSGELAEGEKSSLDEFDLANIDIPEIDLGNLTAVGPQDSTGQTTAMEPATSSAESIQAPPEEMLAMPTLPTLPVEPDEPVQPGEPVAEAPLAFAARETQANEQANEQGLSPNVSQPQPSSPLDLAEASGEQGLILGGDEVELSTHATSSPESAASAATAAAPGEQTQVSESEYTAKSAQTTAGGAIAKLSLPVGLRPRELFEPGEGFDNQNQSDQSAVGPTQTVSSPAAQPGASPTLYDGAGLSTEQLQRPQGLAETVAGPVDTQMPLLSDILATTSPAVPISTVSHSRPAGTAPSNTATAPGMPPSGTSSDRPTGEAAYANQPVQTAAATATSTVATATPEMNRDEIIKAYQRFSELNQMQNGAAVNRFAPSAAPVADGVNRSSPETGFLLGAPR